MDVYTRIPVNRALAIADGKILLLRRALDDRYMPGYWDLPGGKGDDTDEDDEYALRREVREETGLELDGPLQVVHTSSTSYDTGEFQGKQYDLHVFLGRCSAAEVRLSNEHMDYAWVDQSEVANYELTPDISKIFAALSNVALAEMVSS